MKKHNFKQIVLLFGIILSQLVWCNASNIIINKNYSDVTIMESNVQGSPRGSSIQATIDGHTLTVVFTENLGQVAIEITTATGVPVENLWTSTPNGIQTYLSLTGDYIITFTLPNGDEYYGEFTVTD